MDEHHRPNGIPVTRFTLQSIYAQSDDEKLEFEYESGNTNILVRLLKSTCPPPSPNLDFEKVRIFQPFANDGINIC